MKAMLIRVGADQSTGGGMWNGPVDSRTGDFAYAAIPETSDVHPGFEKPYEMLIPALRRFDVELPRQLRTSRMHLDPDFQYLTYGDQGERAKQIVSRLDHGDLIVFYSGLADVRKRKDLVYALIGQMVVRDILSATSIPISDRDSNAHTRRVLPSDAGDIVVRGVSGESGRFKTCIQIGEYRDRAYRVQPPILKEWGGLSVKDGYLQRSGRLPMFLQPERFCGWLRERQPALIQANN